MGLKALRPASWLGLVLVLFSTPPALAANLPRVLTNAAQLRTLTSVEADQRLPVQLRATVTGFNPSSIFIQDSTGGTFINLNPVPPDLKIGDELDLTGLTFAGRFVPGIRSANFHVLGRRSLPPAEPVTYDDLLSGRKHYERVEITGIVRSITVATETTRLVLKVAMGQRKLEVQIAAPEGAIRPPIDSRVRIAGLATGYINNRRQITAPQLLVNRSEDVRIEHAALADPFRVPLSRASSLLNFDSSDTSNHRVRVRGVVTHRVAGEAIFLREGGQGLVVQTMQADAVKPGDVVEVIGFPAMGPFSAFLEDASFRLITREAEPQPIPTTVTAILAGTNDANLIALEAELIEVLQNPAVSILVLRAENTTFQARAPRGSEDLRPGSRLRLVGVCRVGEAAFTAAHFAATPRFVELMARSAADITVLSTPSEWTVKRLATIASVLLGLTLAALVWAGLLRQRVAAQARIISEKVQREAALEERHRMAREMHDTLAQSFSGLGFQLDSLHTKLPPDATTARSQLDVARQMVRHGQEDFRRSLFNLRAQELERGGLTDVLPELARQITTGTSIELRCEIEKPKRRLPEAVETNLLRISQESLVNAVRHAQPKHVDLSLKQEADTVRLHIADDGIGFDPAQLRPEDGHFGLRGIQERAEQIHARFDLNSQPGHGTRITVTVPISA